mgnify:CR=1 FL=1
MKLFRAIAQAEAARKRCEESGNTVWEENWSKRIKEAMDKLPSGSGFGSSVLVEVSNRKMILDGTFHLMNEAGYYDGVVIFRVTVLPGLEEDFGLDVKARGMRWPRKYLDVRDYVAEVYADALSQEAYTGVYE